LTLANGLRIPTIHEALRTADGRVGVLWEIKAEGLAEQLCKEVEQRGFAHPVIYASFFHAELLDLRRREPRAQTMALLEGVPVNPTGFARDAQVTHVGLALDFLSTGLIEALRRARFSVFVYTVNDPADIARVKAIGVDGMISDFPERI
jgi:glycerophosphoryl diester phosphodiesterase